MSLRRSRRGRMVGVSEMFWVEGHVRRVVRDVEGFCPQVSKAHRKSRSAPFLIVPRELDNNAPVKVLPVVSFFLPSIPRQQDRFVPLGLRYS